MLEQSACECGSGRDYASCCQPRHLGLRAAETAEALMRSRYTAFARGLVDYLIKTLHPSKRQLDDLASLSQSVERVSWTGLRVLDTTEGLQGEQEGEVEFVAFWSAGSSSGELHERSRFRHEGGAWFYVDGQPSTRHPRPGRRECCWCGSGQPYGKCHG